MNKKTILASAITIVLLIIGGIYYYTRGGGTAIGGEVYRNEQYGFKMTFPDSWKGFTVTEDTWKGSLTTGPGLGNEYGGTKFVFNNPQRTAQEKWQDIPIMVFTPDVWEMVVNGKVRASSLEDLPEKIGENQDLVFATPPRWTYDNDFGVEEAIAIVKTFKGFKITLEE